MIVTFGPRTEQSLHRTCQAQTKVLIALKLHNQGEFVCSSKFGCRTCSVWTLPCNQMHFWTIFIVCIKAKSCFTHVGTYLVPHMAPTLVRSSFLLLCFNFIWKQFKRKERQTLFQSIYSLNGKRFVERIRTKQDKPVVLNTDNGEMMKEKVRENKQDEAILLVIVKRHADKTKCVTARSVCGWRDSLMPGSGETKCF